MLVRIPLSAERQVSGFLKVSEFRTLAAKR